jgi:flagellar M-ring protein FliF
MASTEAGDLSQATDPKAKAAANLAAARSRMSSTMAGFSRGQKKMMGMATGVVLVGVLALAIIHGKTDWTPLYTQLSPADASAITKKLDSEGVTYQLADGGGTIEVSKDLVYQTRIDMASVSLPSDSTVGYGILDNQSMTSSDFMQQVSYQRAMEGELAKTIDAIDGVEASTVHLALPKDDTFALSDQAPSASVMVKTAVGKTLTSEQTQAVVNLVASSIQNLTANEVTVADSQGNVLASPSTGVTASAGDGSSSDATQAYDHQVGSAIESMLAQSVGAGKVKATVSADLDFDQSAQTSVTYSAPSTVVPNTPLMQQQSTKTETYGGTGTNPAGTLGANNGAGSTDTQTGSTTSGTGYNLDQNNSTPALNKVTQQINNAPGKVNRLSVAVMIDEKSLPQSEVSKVEQMVSAAAGIDTTRGDTVVVQRMPFDTKLQKAMEAQVAAAAPQSSSFPISTIIQGVIALAVLIGLVVTLKRGKATTEPISPDELMLVGGLVHQPIPPSAIIPARDNGQIITLPDQPMVNDRREVLGELIDNQPDEVAQVLRSWLGDRREVRR